MKTRSDLVFSVQGKGDANSTHCTVVKFVIPKYLKFNLLSVFIFPRSKAIYHVLILLFI